MRTRPACLLLLSACLLWNGCTMWTEKPVSSWSSSTGGEHLERLFWRDVKTRNFADLERHLAPTFVSLSAGTVHDRAAAIEHLKELQISEYTLGDFNIQPNGDDMVVTYSVMLHGSYHGQALPPGPVRMMTVWHQVKDQWVAIAHSDSAPPPP